MKWFFVGKQLHIDSQGNQHPLRPESVVIFTDIQSQGDIQALYQRRFEGEPRNPGDCYLLTDIRPLVIPFPVTVAQARTIIEQLVPVIDDESPAIDTTPPAE